MSSYTRRQLEDWLQTIDVEADSVLDVGGGAKPIKSRVKSWKVEKYKILDNRIEEMEVEPDIVCDINDDNGSFFSDEEFDIIFCLEISEYIWNPVMALKNLCNLLKKDGTLYMSFHFIYPVHNIVKHDYLRYTPNGVKKLLKETGFEVLETKPRLELRNYIYDAMVMNGMRVAREYNKHHWVGCMIKAKKL